MWGRNECTVFASPLVWQAPSNFNFTPRICLLPCIHPLHLSSFATLVSILQGLFIILFKCLHPSNSEVTLSRLIWFITDNLVGKERLCTCALNSFIWLETKISLWYVICEICEMGKKTVSCWVYLYFGTQLHTTRSVLCNLMVLAVIPSAKSLHYVKKNRFFFPPNSAVHVYKCIWTELKLRGFCFFFKGWSPLTLPTSDIEIQLSGIRTFIPHWIWGLKALWGLLDKKSNEGCQQLQSLQEEKPVLNEPISIKNFTYDKQETCLSY